LGELLPVSRHPGEAIIVTSGASGDHPVVRCPLPAPHHQLTSTARSTPWRARNRPGSRDVRRATGIFRKRRPSLATVHNRPLRCIICQHEAFWDREVKLNSTAMELLDLAWANRSALGLICANCGFVHEFLGAAVALWKADDGYPKE
jgi:hypothetical protein